MSLRRKRRHKTKNHAQDGGMLGALLRQHPAILPWFLVLGWRPSFRFKSRAPCPFRPASRIAAGRYLFRLDPFGKPFPACFGSCPRTSGLLPYALLASSVPVSRTKLARGRSCKNARQTTRAYFTKSSTSNVVLFDQRQITRFVRLLEIVEKRTARGDHFQQAAA